MAKAANSSPDVEVITWWLNHVEDLPHRSSAAQMVALVQPSSAAVESFFHFKSIFWPSTRQFYSRLCRIIFDTSVQSALVKLLYESNILATYY